MAVLGPGFLRGVWSVRRAINGDPDAFVGTAEFTPDGDGLTWHESGRLRLGDFTGEARRTYLVRGEPPRVCFDDGRFFHELREGAVEHLCGPDVYRGEWTVHGAGAFTVAWRVSGPGREDEIVCDYVRGRAARRSASARTSA